jgi:hypothetical protein
LGNDGWIGVGLEHQVARRIKYAGLEDLRIRGQRHFQFILAHVNLLKRILIVLVEDKPNFLE